MTPEEFAILIARISDNDPTLTEINLFEGEYIKLITTEEAAQLSEALIINTNVITLIVTSVIFGNNDEASQSFANALEVNEGMRYLGIDFGKFSLEGKQMIENALTINTRIEILPQ